MRFICTRGGEPCGFTQALARGRSPQGGLYLPQEWPQLAPEDIAACGRRPLADTVAAMLLGFAGLDLDPELNLTATREAFTVFGHPAVAPLRELDQSLWLLDLTRGPTMSAADIEMQVLARLISYAVASRGRSITLLLATSGDDGPAAVEALRDRAGVGLVLLFPVGDVTAAQRRAMTDPAARNIRAVAVDGSARDCRALAAAALADPQLSADVSLGSIGPENIGRLAISAAVLLAAAARLGAPEREISFAAPAGEGTLEAAATALVQMGLRTDPVLAVERGPMAATLDDQRYRRPADAAQAAWDCQPDWPFAFERLYFEASGRHVLETTRAARAFKDAGYIDLPPGVRQRLGRWLRGATVDQSETAGTAMAALNVAGERLDMASAAVVAAARRFSGSGHAALIAPVLGHPAWTATDRSGQIEDGDDLPPQLRRPQSGERCDYLANDPDALGAYLRAFAGLSRAA